VGAVNFEPLKPLFLAVYRSSHVYLSTAPSLPPLQLHIRRNPDETSPSKVLPVVAKSLQSIKSTELMEAYRAVAANRLADAAVLFRSILLSLLLVVVTTPDEATQVGILSLISQPTHLYLYLLSLLVTRRHHNMPRVSFGCHV
jgi:coatomer protein complex subunit alpha (xenin)